MIEKEGKQGGGGGGDGGGSNSGGQLLVALPRLFVCPSAAVSPLVAEAARGPVDDAPTRSGSGGLVNNRNLPN